MKRFGTNNETEHNGNGKSVSDDGIDKLVSQRQFNEPETEELREYIDILYRRRKIVVFTLLAILIIGIVYTLTRTPIYESSARIVVVTNNNTSPQLGDNIQMINDLRALVRSRSIDTQLEIISSPDVLNNAFENIDPKLRAKGFRSDHLPSWACKVSAKKNTDIIIVTARAFDPKAAAELANNVSKSYFEQDLERSRRATRQAREYAEEQLAVLHRDLAKANTELSEYKRKTGLIAPDAQISKIAERMANLQMEIDAVQANIAAGRNDLEATKQGILQEKADVITSSTITRNPLFDEVVTRLDRLQSQRAEMLQEYTPQSREIRALDERIKIEEERLKTVAGNVVASRTESRNPIRDSLLKRYAEGIATNAALTARNRALLYAMNSQKTFLATLPEKERKLTDLIQSVELLKGTYQNLSQRYYSLLLSERAMIPNGQLISKAAPSSTPTYPNKKRNFALFFVLGIMIASIAAVTIEKLDVRVHDQQSVEQIANTPVLTLVPKVAETSKKLIEGKSSDSKLLESFRILRSNILFSIIDHDTVLIAVTSAGPSEGKSTVSANLAIAMAMDGKKVLLIDGDMRKPNLHNLFGMTRENGLSSVIAGSCRQEDAIKATHVQNLDLLPSGPTPPNAPEMLNSRHCRNLLEHLKSIYDIVIIDCPPCVGLSDVQVVSTLADGVVLVVAMNETRKPHLKIASHVLSRVSAPLIGVVLNKIDSLGNSYYYKYYSNYTYLESCQKTSPKNGKRRKTIKRWPAFKS